MYAVTVAPGSEFRTGVPRALFGGRFPRKNTTNWDVAPDGQRFVMVRAPEASAEGATLNVVLHRFDQLRSPPR